MKRLINKKNIIITLIALVALTACNLDSSHGVFQKKFADSASNSIPVDSILGIDGESVIFVSRGDIYSTDGKKDTKIAEMTKYNENDFRITPLFANDGYIYLMCCDKGINESSTSDDRYFIFYATAEELNKGISITSTDDAPSIAETNKVEIILEDGNDPESISFIAGPSNFNLDTTYLLYSIAGENDGKSPNEKIKHYGFINHAEINTDSITIHGGVSVHESSRIFGDRVVRSYRDGSDLNYSNLNHFYLIDETGTEIEFEKNFTAGDYDKLPMGSDFEYVISLDGDKYDIKNNKWSDLESDLIYRVNDTMPIIINDNGDKIGYLYEGGIYINPVGNDTAPYSISVSEDNDLITSAWIGYYENNYLMMTQKNGLRVISLIKNENGRYSGTVEKYNPDEHGNLSLYIN